MIIIDTVIEPGFESNEQVQHTPVKFITQGYGNFTIHPVH